MTATLKTMGEKLFTKPVRLFVRYLIFSLLTWASRTRLFCQVAIWAQGWRKFALRYSSTNGPARDSSGELPKHFLSVKAGRQVGAVIVEYNRAFISATDLVLKGRRVVQAPLRVETAKRVSLGSVRSGISEDIGSLYFHGRSNRVQLDSGIWLAGAGSSNWFHWLLGEICKGPLAENIDHSIPLVIPEFALQKLSFMESLSLSFPQRPYRAVSDFSTVKIKRSVTLSPPIWLPLNFRPDQWYFEAGDYIFNESLLREARTRLLAAADAKIDPTADRCLFLSRTNEKRGYNQSEVERFFQGEGYVSVSPEALTFKSQIKLFHNAEKVAGPVGAALANILFMRPGCSVEVWGDERLEDFPIFKLIAKMVGLEFRFTSVSAPALTSMSLNSAEYKVDVGQLSKRIDR